MHLLEAKIVLKCTYMDDSIDSVETVLRWHSVVQRALQSVGNCRHEGKEMGIEFSGSCCTHA